MSALAASAATGLAEPPPALRIGRPFVHPLFDLMLIGGGLSLIVTAILTSGGGRWLALGETASVVIVLVTNMAHFASSTVRLYTKPDAFHDYRFLTMGLPLATLATLTLALAFADVARNAPPEPLPHLVPVPLRRAGLRPGRDVLLPLRLSRSRRWTGGWCASPAWRPSSSRS